MVVWGFCPACPTWYETGLCFLNPPRPAASYYCWKILGWRGRCKAGKGRTHWNLGLNCGMLPDADMGYWQKHSSGNFIARVRFLTITFMLWNSVQGKSKTWRRMRLPLDLDYHGEQYLKVCWLVFQGFGLFLGAMGKQLPFQRQEMMLTSQALRWDLRRCASALFSHCCYCLWSCHHWDWFRCSMSDILRQIYLVLRIWLNLGKWMKVLCVSLSTDY